MGSDPFIGEIVMFAGNFAPRGWALCDGQLLQISQNAALFSILGTTYGGDGRTTFGLPDLRGRVSMHPGSGPGLVTRRLGEKSGSETNTLSVTQMPAHTHSISPRCDDVEGTSFTPKGHFPAKTTVADGNPLQYGGPGADQMGSSTSDATGGGQAVNNLQPYQCVNYIIALVGVFPSRT